MPFCKAFERVLIILLNSMNSDQATVRSKSLKSVIQLLEKDPTILDRGAYVMRYIINRASDSSPLVRDSALSLIGRCLTLRPALEDQVCESILARSMDAAVGVRKRSMKILKDIYLRNSKKDIKSAIASALLHRVKDSDQGVSDLARQTFEEIWISPFYRPAGVTEETAQYKLAITEGVAIIVKTVQRGDSVSPVLDGLLQTILSNDSKNNAANFRVCKSMVAAMFDDILDGQEEPDKPGRQHILQTLTVFAKANPRLLTPEQLQLLQPYVENLSKNDDLHVYRSVIVIFRCALPHLSGLQTGFLTAVQKALMESVSKLGKRELNEVIFCLWSITGVLKNVDRLLRLTVSCLKGIYATRNTDLTDEAQKAGIGRVTRYMTIAGLLGKHCDFENEPKRFKDEFPWWKGNSVSGLMVDVFSFFTSPRQPLAVRKAAIEGLGLICQSHPKNFLKEQVYSAFDIVFAEENRELENLTLTGFKDFLAIEEKRSEKGADLSELDGGVDVEVGRLSGVTTANQNDGVTTSIAQRYLKHITRIALATQDVYALTAVEVIASINRQGLVHPKECGPVLVALETSQHQTIASIAFHEHRALHQKHETLVEREYMKAVEQAFQYQKDVVGDPSGATASPFTSKLRPLFDVIKISRGKIRKKFISGLCSKIDFDPARLDVTSDPPVHLEYAKFVIENLAFFEYSTVDELLHVIASMERVVAGTGTSVAHAIETEVFMVQLLAVGADGLPITIDPVPVDGMRLRQLTASSMILSLLWDTRSFIRRLYGLNNSQKQREGKGKQASKALNNAPTRVSGVTGDKLWEEIRETMAALTSADTMMAQCKEFVEMLSVDQDFKLAAEGEEDGYDLSRMKTPDYENEEDGTPAPPGSGRGSKRKAGSETPAKRSRKRARSSGGKARRIMMDESDDGFDD
jgi:cohesin loading factor subunit SCC2